MVSTVAALYVVTVSVLFFFWVYGIYAFVRDTRRRYLPMLREHWATRRASDGAGEDDEREERKRQLY